MNIAILASGNGTNLQAIIDAIEAGVLDASVSVVISNNSKSGAMERAAGQGIRCRHLSSVRFPDFNDLDGQILAALKETKSDIVFLAGYMKKIGPKVLSFYEGRILNTHPALLPDFGGKGMYGMNVHKAVIDSGRGKSGVTVHLVNAEYDQGRIVAQAEVPVMPGDTPEQLCERVMTEERKFIIEVLNKIQKKEISINTKGK